MSEEKAASIQKELSKKEKSILEEIPVINWFVDETVEVKYIKIDGFENSKPIGTELTHEGTKDVHKLDFGHIHNIDHTNYSWFEQKLANPRIFDRGRVVASEDKLRMPNFYFTSEEIEAITTAILGFNSNKYSDGMLIENLVDDKNVFKGYSLIQRYNCQGCHVIDGFGGQIGFRV